MVAFLARRESLLTALVRMTFPHWTEHGRQVFPLDIVIRTTP